MIGAKILSVNPLDAPQIGTSGIKERRGAELSKKVGIKIRGYIKYPLLVVGKGKSKGKIWVWLDILNARVCVI